MLLDDINDEKFKYKNGKKKGFINYNSSELLRFVCYSCEIESVKKFKSCFLNEKIKEKLFCLKCIKRENGKMSSKTKYEEKNNPTTYAYWISKGYTKEEAKEEILKKHIYNKSYWISKGYTEEEAKERIYKHKKNNPSFPSFLYWISKGYTEEEAINMRNEIVKKRMINLLNVNPLVKQSWISKGYTEEEAIDEVKRQQKIRRTEERSKKLSISSKKFQENISQEKKEEIKQKIKNSLNKFKNTHSPIFKEYWIEKNYSIEESTLRAAKVRTTYKDKKRGYSRSKKEIKLCENLKKEFSNLKENEKIIINGKLYIPDIIINDNIIIEFFGTYYHKDPRFFKISKYLKKKNIIKSIWINDIRRIKSFLKKKYNVFIVWEFDWNNNEKKILEEIRTIINENDFKKKYWTSSGVFNKRKK